MCAHLPVRVRDVGGYRDTKTKGNREDVHEDRDREATAEFAILPTALIRREIRSSMVKQLASSPDHMKPSPLLPHFPSSLGISSFPPPHPLPPRLFPRDFDSMLFAPFPWADRDGKRSVEETDGSRVVLVSVQNYRSNFASKFAFSSFPAIVRTFYP